MEVSSLLNIVGYIPDMFINISTSKSTSILGLNADVSWHEGEWQDHTSVLRI